MGMGHGRPVRDQRLRPIVSSKPSILAAVSSRVEVAIRSIKVAGSSLVTSASSVWAEAEKVVRKRQEMVMVEAVKLTGSSDVA